MSTLNPKILAVPQGQDACGIYRIVNPAQLMQLSDMPVTITPSHDFGPAALYDVAYTQRMATEKSLIAMKGIKDRTGIKLIVDFDDLVWDYQGYGLPEYNIAKSRIDTKGNREALLKYGNEVFDKVTCTNEYLKKAISEFVDPKKIYVMPNRLPIKEWLFDTATSIPADDIFFFAGSITHYDPVNKKPGDFSNGWVNYLKNKKVAIMGKAPYFVNNPVAEYPYCHLNSYAHNFYNYARRSKFIIAPLADNIFNKCKSNLKYLESCAVGRVCLVTDFEDSPYHDAHKYQKIPVNATAQTINYIVERAKEHYAEILQYQYNYLKNYWLDNHINEYKEILK